MTFTSTISTGAVIHPHAKLFSSTDDIDLANEKIRQIQKQADDFPDFLKAAILTMKERDKKKLCLFGNEIHVFK
jgi:hypothetical protein